MKIKIICGTSKVYNNTSEAMKGMKGVIFIFIFPFIIIIIIIKKLLNSIDERKERNLMS
jgi:hypothetical protein